MNPPRRTLAEEIAAAAAAQEAAEREAVDPAGWDAAVAAWDVVVTRLPGGLTDGGQSRVLDAAARTRLSRWWADGPSEDLDAAADLLRGAAQVMPEELPQRAAILNNFGVVQRELWEREGRPDLIDGAVDAGRASAAASDGCTPEGVRARLRLGKTLRMRFADRRRRDDIEEAVVALRAATIASYGLIDAERAECHEALGNGLYDRHQVAKSTVDRRAAVVHLRRAVDLTPAHDSERPSYLSNLASALLDGFEIDGRCEDLDEAVELLEAALTAAGGYDGASSQLLSNLGNALRLRSVANASVGDVERAVGLLVRAVEREAGGARRAGMLNNLAAGLLERYDLTGQIADVGEAIDALDEAIALTPADHPDRGARLSNLGIALRSRQLRRRGGRVDIDRAVAAFEEALAAVSELAPDAAAFHANLGNALHQRHDVMGDSEDLDRAVREQEAALALTPDWSADRPGYLNNLAATLTARAARRSGVTEDIDRAVRLAGDAVRLCPPGSAQRATFLVNLGNAASERALRSGDRHDLVTGREAYRRAARTGLTTSPAAALAAVCNWSEWARDRREWSEVAEAYVYGERATRVLFRAQLLREDRESWLRDAEGLATDAAYALASRRRLRPAVTALERGRALLLSQTLEREQADLGRLDRSHPPLAARFRDAVARVRGLELQLSASPTPGRRDGGPHAPRTAGVSYFPLKNGST